MAIIILPIVITFFVWIYFYKKKLRKKRGDQYDGRKRVRHNIHHSDTHHPIIKEYNKNIQDHY